MRGETVRQRQRQRRRRAVELREPVSLQSRARVLGVVLFVLSGLMMVVGAALVFASDSFTLLGQSLVTLAALLSAGVMAWLLHHQRTHGPDSKRPFRAGVDQRSVGSASSDREPER